MAAPSTVAAGIRRLSHDWGIGIRSMEDGGVSGVEPQLSANEVVIPRALLQGLCCMHAL